MNTQLMLVVCCLAVQSHAQVTRGVGKFQEVFAWRQLVYNINGVLLTEDRPSAAGLGLDGNSISRQRRQTVFFDNDDDTDRERDWDSQSSTSTTRRPWRTTSTFRPDYPTRRTSTTPRNRTPTSTTEWNRRRTTTTEWDHTEPNQQRRTTTTDQNRPSTTEWNRRRTTTTEWDPTESNQRRTTTTDHNRPSTTEWNRRRTTTTEWDPTESNQRRTTTTDHNRRWTTTTQSTARPTSTTEWNRRRTTTTESNPWRTTEPNSRRTTTTDQNRRWTTTTQRTATNESGAFFIQYNNIPMGAERVGNRLFVAVPRRRYGVPSTLNYLDLTEDSNVRSPGLRPYPNLRQPGELTSVYRTRADDCGRLWMVDTGMLEIPNNRQQVRPPAIVIYDLRTDRQILRYPFKSTDLPSELTPSGLASITVDVTNSSCDSAYAYVPDLVTYGLIVFSLRERDSWRLTHNFFSFDPAVGNLVISGQRFSWNDGLFSVTLTEPGMGGCRTAYFHAMVSTREFSVSTCVLQNRTASSDSNFWAQFALVGDRGADSHSTMHGYHAGSGAIFFASMARDGIACWHSGNLLSSTAVQLLARDSAAMAYPADLHVTGDELWVLTNSLPTWIYSRLDTNEYNFHIYRANIYDLISGTVCTGRPVTTFTRSGVPGDDEGSLAANSDDAQ